MIRLLEPWRTRLLWLSLAGTLFAVALLAAPRVWHRRPPSPPGFKMLIERMAHDLPPGDAETLRAAMEREQPWYDLSRRRLEEARATVGRTVAQAPYDPVAVRAALIAMQQLLRESAVRFDDSLVMALSQLSPEGRVKLSESMQRRRP